MSRTVTGKALKFVNSMPSAALLSMKDWTG